jgi:cytochrome c556
MRNQMMMQQQMLDEMKQRQMQMASSGGENPWEVAYNKEQASTIAESEKGADLKDSASDKGAGMLEKATRSFSF